MKYYFITLQATNREGSVSIWNQVINESPMKFIKRVQSTVERNQYYGFVVLNTCKISKEDFQEFKDQF